MAEQRRETRVEDPPINIQGDWTTVYNLSLGGICIVSVEPLKVGWYRTFTLVDRSGSACILSGQVRWTVLIGQGLTRAGLQWIDLDSDSRHWLAKQMGSRTYIGSEATLPALAR
jgi:hypothetical protein